MSQGNKPQKLCLFVACSGRLWPQPVLCSSCVRPHAFGFICCLVELMNDTQIPKQGEGCDVPNQDEGGASLLQAAPRLLWATCVCVTASAPQRCAKHLLLCEEEGRGEDNGRCPPSDGVGKQRRQIRSMESELLHSNRIRRKEARAEIRSWDQWAHEKAGQRSWPQQRNSLGLVLSEKEPRTQRRASLQESK